MRGGACGLSPAALRYPDFPRRVRLEFLELVKNTVDANAIDRLQCFKNAMVNVSRNLSRSHTNLEAVTAVGDKLGVTMKSIRAVEKGSVGEINVCRQLYPGSFFFE